VALFINFLNLTAYSSTFSPSLCFIVCNSMVHLFLCVWLENQLSSLVVKLLTPPLCTLSDYHAIFEYYCYLPDTSLVLHLLNVLQLLQFFFFDYLFSPSISGESLIEHGNPF